MDDNKVLPLVSIIVPALNEEERLPTVLGCAKSQTYDPKEIIVSVSPETTDRSVEVARQYGAKVVEGGIYAVARNNGAKIARGEYFFFFDADIAFGPEAVESAMKKILRRRLDFGMFNWGFRVENDQGKRAPLLKQLVYLLLNQYMALSNRVTTIFRPVTIGHSTFISRVLFEKLGGYDESMMTSEDVDLGKRAARAGGRYGVIHYKTWHSNRRVEEVGVLKYILIILLTFPLHALKREDLIDRLYKRRVDDGKYISE